MRNLLAFTLILASCVPPVHPEYAGADTAYERGDAPQVVRNVIEKQFEIERETPTEFTSAWKPLYDKDEDVHYRLRAIAKVVAAGPYRFELVVLREDKDFVSGNWHARGSAAEEEERLRRDIHRALGSR